MIKSILYAITFLLSLYSLTAIDYNKFVKKNKITEIKLLMLLLSLSVAYLSTNFLYDFINNFIN